MSFGVLNPPRGHIWGGSYILCHTKYNGQKNILRPFGPMGSYMGEVCIRGGVVFSGSWQQQSTSERSRRLKGLSVSEVVQGLFATLFIRFILHVSPPWTQCHSFCTRSRPCYVACPGLGGRKSQCFGVFMFMFMFFILLLVLYYIISYIILLYYYYYFMFMFWCMVHLWV